MDKTISLRSKHILKILLDRNEPITIGQLEKLVGVSNKTISNDLDRLEYWLKPYNGIIIRKPNMGIYLDVDDKTKIILYDLIGTTSYQQPDTPEERQYYILRRLLEEEDTYITVQQLADEIFVSKSTLSRDLYLVEQWLNKRYLKLLGKPNRGLKIQGSEKNIRLAFADLLVEVTSKGKVLRYLRCLNDSIIHENIKYCLTGEIESLLNKTDLDTIICSFKKLENKLTLRFSDDAFTSIVVHIAIAIVRIKKGKIISLDSKTMLDLQKNKEYELVLEMIEELEKGIGLSFPEAEVVYITMHILGGTVEPSFINNGLNSLIELNLNEKLILSCEKMIKKASKILNGYEHLLV